MLIEVVENPDDRVRGVAVTNCSRRMIATLVAHRWCGRQNGETFGNIECMALLSNSEIGRLRSVWNQ